MEQGLQSGRKVGEILKKIEKKWIENDFNLEDEELQKRFWMLFGPNKIKSPNLRIGANFLRENKNLLQ